MAWRAWIVTFVIAALPSLPRARLPLDCAVDGFGRGGGKFLSGDGKWEIEKDFIAFGLTLRIADGGSMSPGIYAGPWIAIRRRSSPHVLEITVGDPDCGESIRYERDSRQ